jgi:hypothetical protein
MERRVINSKLLTSGWFSLGFLVLGAIGSVLYSPKWHNLVYLASAYDVAPLPFNRNPYDCHFPGGSMVNKQNRTFPPDLVFCMF